jgi:hypothetical protein
MRSKAQETVLGRGKKAKNKRQQQNWQQHPTFQIGEFEIFSLRVKRVSSRYDHFTLDQAL